MKNKKPLVTRLQEAAIEIRGVAPGYECRYQASLTIEEAIAEIFRLERLVKPLPRSADDAAP